MRLPPLRHLLKPGEYRVWCRPSKDPTNLVCTKLPSTVTCARCLTAYRWSKGVRRDFRVAHVNPSRFKEESA